MSIINAMFSHNNVCAILLTSVILSVTFVRGNNDAEVELSSSEADWWKQTIVYQIYPRSFQDSDGDGIGDIRGIISRLDHFNYLNVGAIWLSPIYPSPMVDHGYDVQDFTDIDPIFGTLADFDELIAEAHRRGIRVLMDYIPNHTSYKHKWFVESRRQRGPDNVFSDFYIWSDGRVLDNGTRVPPNNWQSCFTGPAWTWDSNRNQYYYHKFCPEQPDLNYRNPLVRQEMQNVLQFWLDRGVDGFRVDAIAQLFEVEDLFLDEEPDMQANTVEAEFLVSRSYTRSLPEIHDVVREWRQLFDRHYNKTAKYTFMMVEVYETIENSMKYYSSGADMPLNMWLIRGDSDCHAKCFRQLIDAWLSVVPDGKWPNFVIGNHDRTRVSKRKGEIYVNAMNVLLLTLPGTPTTYYGEEIGMTNVHVSYEDTQDPWGKNMGPELYLTTSRDPSRSPMQWNHSTNAGFSISSETWLPINEDYVEINVESQKGRLNSPLEIYRQVARLRRESSSFKTQHVQFLPGTDDVIAYIRYNPNDNDKARPYLVAINLGLQDSRGVGTDVVVLAGTEYYEGVVEFNSATAGDSGDQSSMANITDVQLSPGQACIIRLTAGHSKDEL